VQIIRPEQAYELGIDSATQRHFLIGHGMNVEDQWALLMSNQFPIAPFAYRVVELGNFFFLVTPQATKPYLRIDSVALQAAADSDSPEAIAVITTASTRFELLRNRRWAVHRISSRSEEADEKGVLITEWRQACEYAGDSDGFPLLKSVTYEVFSNRGAGEELNPLERDVFQVTQLVAEPPPMESFDVEMILGRKRVVTQEGGDRLWWVLVLNGLVLFVIGGYMLRRQRRQHGQPSGPGSAASPPQ
jgi:hypothetical protein